MGVKSEFSTIVFYPVPNIVLSIYFLAGVIRANHLWLLAPSPPFPSSLILNTLFSTLPYFHPPLFAPSLDTVLQA